MKLEEVRYNWNRFGEQDPLWAILRVAPDGSPWTVEEFFATGVEEVARVVAHLRKIGVAPGGVALDFGCGIGRLTQAMCARFDGCHGVDIAESMVTRARELNRHGERCRSHLNTREDLSLFAGETFDFIYSSIVLQHLEPRYSSAYIREFLRVLKPGGVAVFQLPSRHTWRRLARRPAATQAARSAARSRVLFAGWSRRRRGPGSEPSNPPSPSAEPRIQPSPPRRADEKSVPVMEMHWIPRAEVEALVVTPGRPA